MQTLSSTTEMPQFSEQWFGSLKIRFSLRRKEENQGKGVGYLSDSEVCIFIGSHDI